MINRKQLIIGGVLFAIYLSTAPSPLQASGVQSGNAAYYVQALGNDKNNGLSRENPFQTLAKAVDAAKTSRIKRITVIGMLMEESEQHTALTRDPESVFYIKDSGRAEITIRGLNRAQLNAAGTGKRVIKIAGKSRIRFEHIAITHGDLGATSLGAGGGVYVAGGGIIILGNGAAVSGNSAAQGGGVFILGSEAVPVQLILEGGKIVNNTAAGSLGEAGGGLYIHYGLCRILEGEVSGNTASDDNGGGLLVKQSILEISGGSINGNTGGGAYIIGSALKMEGGVIQNNQAAYNAGGMAVVLSTFTMTGGSILDNTAGGAGGGVFGFQSIYTLSGGEIANNAADYGGGVCIDATGSSNSIDFTMTGGTIHRNQARQSGGGVFVLNGTIEIRENAMLNNNTALSGGGVGVENSALYVSGKARIQDNSLSGKGHGGGIYVTTGILELTGGRISGNTGLYGGGVSALDCTFTMSNTAVISGNTSENSGGGVFVGNGTFEMTGGEISNNTSDNSGGGLYVGGYCTALLAGGSITGNRSAKEGGGIDVKAHNIVTLTGVTISGNKAEKGGAVHVWEQGVFNMWNHDIFNPEGGAIIGNEAHIGGGVYIDKGGDIIQNSGSFEGNKPEDIIREDMD
ncbi:MAG: hypothetical protein LBD55_08080 [Treponema sp.]|jgi:hypothetical protein|nr:hypothetical protein [Treponema sp.]